MKTREAWYESWFDTEFYHILYQHRDDNEASLFINQLVEQLEIPHSAHILDLACGRGRHARYLSDLDYEVTGIDLSESNIDFARQFENQKLHFETGDMREDLGANRFNFIFNLFTSFGYFEDRSENVQSLRMMKRALKKGGELIMDFMNVEKVELGLVEEEIRTANGIEFHIHRFIRDNRVIKDIRFEYNGDIHQYEERVQLLDYRDFQQMFAEAGLQINRTFGDFDLRSFNPRTSERLIMQATAI